MFSDGREDWELKASERLEKEARRSAYKEWHKKAFSEGVPLPPEKMPIMPIFLVLAVFLLVAAAVRIDRMSDNNGAIQQSVEKPVVQEKIAIPPGALLIKKKIKATLGKAWVHLIETETSTGSTYLSLVSEEAYDAYQEGALISEDLFKRNQ